MQDSRDATEVHTNLTTQFFLGYAHADRTFCLRLEEELSRIASRKAICVWSDRELVPGDDWEQEVRKALDRARIILLLISLEFLASEQCNQETKIALERRRASDSNVRVIPVPLTRRGWERCEIRNLQAVPALPVEEWNNDDEALADISRQLKTVCDPPRKPPARLLARLGSDRPLLVSLNSGVFGGAIGGTLAGGLIARGYNLTDPPNVSALLMFMIVVFVAVGGTLLGLTVHWSILRFRRLAIRQHLPGIFFNELFGGCIGGAVSFGLTGFAAGALFQPRGSFVIDPALVVSSAVGGAILIPFFILFYDFKGLLFDFKGLRSAISTFALLTLSVVIEFVVWYMVQPAIDLDRYCGESGGLWACARAGSVYLAGLGILLGFCIGLTLLLHRLFRQMRTSWIIQSSVA